MSERFKGGNALMNAEPPQPKRILGFGETPPSPEPVQPANPSAQQTPSPVEPVHPPNPPAVAEPVPAANPTGSPQRTGSPTEPVRVTDGFTAVTNHLLDDVLPALEPHEQVTLLRIYRLTRGHGTNRCKVSRKKLGAKTRVKRTRLLEALAVLEERGYIKRLPDDVSSGDVYDRGMNLEILLPGREPVRDTNPSARRTGSAREPNKESIKDNLSKSVVCDLCRGQSGMVYRDRDNPSLGVKRCDHGEGK
jgi:DNA-binding MarR family transcriptional regulator